MKRYTLLKQSAVEDVDLGCRIDLLLDPGTELEWDGTVLWVLLNGSRYASSAPFSRIQELVGRGCAKEAP